MSADEALQLALECLAPLGPRRWMAYGFAHTPRGQQSRLAVTAGSAGECAIEHVAFHPDLTQSNERWIRHGFTLVFVAPLGQQADTLTLTVGDATLRADLRAPDLSSDIAAATTARDWSATLHLFAACSTEPALAPLLEGEDFGVFANWIAALPALPGRAGQTGPFAEIEALCSPAGEVLLVLRGVTPLPSSAKGMMALAGRVDGDRTSPRVLTLQDQYAGAQMHAFVMYGRVDATLLGRLQGLELLAEIEAAPGQTVRLRAHPRLVAAPNLLDAASRLTATPGLRSGAFALAGAALLQPILAAREAAFAPLLEASLWPSVPVGKPRLIIVLNAHDQQAVRLIHVMAAEFEKRADRLLVLGEAAEDIAQLFIRRARLSVETGTNALQRLRAAPDGVIAVEVESFAETIIEDRIEDAFDAALDAEVLAQLQTLHNLAGFTLALDDSLARLLRRERLAKQHRGGEAALVPLMRPWSSNLAAERVHDHLAGLWARLPVVQKASPDA